MLDDVRTGSDTYPIAELPDLIYILADYQLYRLGMEIRKQKKDAWIRDTEEGAKWNDSIGKQRVLRRLHRVE